MRKLAARALLVSSLVSYAALSGDASAQPKAEGSASEPTERGISSGELQKMLAPLSEPDVDGKRAAVKAVSELGVSATDAIAAKLAELRKSSAPAIQAAMKAVKEQAKAGGEGFDLADALVNLKGEQGASAALTCVALLRALGHIGTTPAARELVLAAQDAGGTLRPELTRQMKVLGERALAALIETKVGAPHETRLWAMSVLDVLNKRLPSDAVQTKNNQVLSDVLRAYGRVKDLDAVPVILSFVNSERAQVRVAARESIAAYGQDATWKLKESYVALTGKQPAESVTAEQLAKELFDAYDKVRLQEVYALLDDGLAKQKEGKLEDAVRAFDRVLARQPMLDRREEMIAGYVQYADSVEAKNRAASLATLRKALRLNEGGVRAPQIKSRIQYLEGMDLLDRGVVDVGLFQSAIALDPGNEKAREQLASLEKRGEDKKSGFLRYLAGAVVLLLAVGGVILFGGRRKRLEPPRPAT